ncbi:MAG: aldehyde dehydrogenase [Microbacterium sp.]|uniref:aldehyde dehydrogenase n=1 Tax=Microbacterium sp. TaxID=51671 RepID=UPI00261E2AFF|nr:aldehyde dehydrogenase [Microbacterium sp.]MCX6501054.1 aldehyde dehydrogenase [Microbacterium sp.]
MPRTTTVHARNFAGGAWLTPSSTDTIAVENPFDHAIVGTAPDSSAADVDLAVGAARDAFDRGPWGRSTPAERADWIDRLADELEARGDATAALITDEIGQPAGLARGMGAIRPVQHLRFYARLARELTTEVERPNGDRDGFSIIRREPVGVAALIVPWNHPQASITMKMAPALAAGCTVVIKPAAESPLDVAQLIEAAIAIGLPPGVINVVTGGRETGRALVEHPGVDKIAFTGSTAAGRQIAEVAGRRLIPVTLELGGKSAAVVLPGADVAATLASLRTGSFGNTGQNCVALSRILAPADLYDELRDGLVALARDLRVGDPKDAATEVGPLVTRTALERVTGMVERARAEGATVLAGDTALPDTGYFYAPAIVEGADPDSELAQNEIFGPVISLHPYADVDDAVRIANATSYGLGGAVFGADDDEVLRVARRVRTGSIGLQGYRPDINLPFGGVRASGLGRELGPEAVSSYLVSKSIFI